jgi:DNA replication and repair protein RecF
VAWSSAGLTRSLNGKSAPLADHLAALPVIAWTAADVEVVGGPPRARRRFLDQGLVGLRPASLGLLTRYRKALEQKRELLARGGGGLGSWNEVLAAAAAELIERREAYVERLSAELQTILSRLDLPPIEIRYRPSPRDGAEGATTILAAFEKARPREVDSRSPELGPHRDELEILWGEHGARRVVSAGERKLLGLALTTARGRLLAASGRSPVYLLDDLDSELDPDRLAQIWTFFTGAEQIFASSNRPVVWEALEVGSRWRLDGAGLHPG